MRCKVCNRELIEGTRRCPHCGSEIPSSDDSSAEEFKWNVQDFPKPKKKKDVSIDWKSGRILDKEAGLVYDQSMNGWTEPENVSELFSFDTQNEQLQQKLDREMARITDRPSSGQRRGLSGTSSGTIDFHILDDTAGRQTGAAEGGSADAAEKQSGKNRLHFFSETSPRTRTSDTFEEENPWKRLREQKTEKKKTEKTAAHPKSDTVPAPATDSDSIYEKDIFTPEPLHFHRLSDSLKSAETTAPAKAPDENSASASETGKTSRSSESSGSAGNGQDAAGAADQRPQDSASGGENIPAGREGSFSGEKKTPSEENVLSGFRKLIEAEKKFKEDMEKISYLSPEEYRKAEKAESQSQKLKFVPTISFRTIEDEYESYRREQRTDSGQALRETERSRTDSLKSRTDTDPDKKEKDKEIQIKINEPSGTKFTVKTQEISLASLNNDTNIRTREVNLDSVKKPPKNVQVSVEVNAAQGNASVEVTRRHDGATVVKTLDESNAGQVYFDGKNIIEEPEPSDTGDSEDKTAKYPENAEHTENMENTYLSDIPDDPDTRVSSAVPESPENPDDSGDSEAAGTEQNREDTVSRSLQSEAIASGLASSEAVQQTIPIVTTSEDSDPSEDTAEDAADLAAVSTQTGDEADHTPDSADSFAGSGPSEATESRHENNSSGDSSGDRFWEKNDDTSKMTITDIFGPDAHRIMEEGIRYRFGPQSSSRNSAEEKSEESAGSAMKTEKDAAEAAEQQTPDQHEETRSAPDSAEKDDSLILDIRPEDIAPSASQTAALHMPSPGTESVQKRGVTTDTISEERQTEMQEAFEALDTINEAERRRLLKEEKKAEREHLREKREAARAEKAERKAQAKEKREKSVKPDDTDAGSENSSSFGPVAKGLIIALTVILIVEFLIIGIKLLAPDSGAAALIDRFESQITGIFSEDNTGPVSAADSSSGNIILPGESSD